MTHEELIDEYEALHYQLYGQSVDASGESYERLLVTVRSMYAQFPAVPNLTKE